MQEKKIYEMQADIFKALSDPTRLYFLDLLSRGPLCVCELAEKVELDMSTVSRHLGKMRDAGIISMEKRGKSAYYSLQLNCFTRLTDCINNVLKNRAKQFNAALDS